MLFQQKNECSLEAHRFKSLMSFKLFTWNTITIMGIQDKNTKNNIGSKKIKDKSNNIMTKLYDKRDAFGFHIVNLPFMSSNIPSAPACGVYASQLIRCARCCSNYSDFLSRHSALVTRLQSQGYKVNCLSNTFKKFYGRHTDLVGQYQKNVCQMLADSIS